MNDLKFLISHYTAELWSRRWTVLGTAWLVTIVGCLMVASLPDRFESTAQVYVDTESLITVFLKDKIITQDVERRVQNVRDSMFARPNLKRIIRMTDLDLNVESEIEEDRLIKSIEQRLTLVQEGRDFYRIKFYDNDPKVAERVVQAVLTVFVEVNLGSTASKRDDAVVVLNRQIDKAHAELRQAEAQLADFRRNNIDELRDGVALQVRLSQAEQSLRDLAVERSRLEARRDQLTAALASTPQTIVTGYVGGGGGGGGGVYTESPEEQRLRDLQSQLSAAKLSKTDRHPDVIALTRLVGEARNAARANPGRHSSGGGGRAPRELSQPNPYYRQLQSELGEVELNLSQMGRRKEDAESSIAEVRDILERQPEVTQQLVLLQEDVNKLKGIADDLDDQKRKAELSADVNQQTSLVDFRIVEPPIESVTPAGPNRLAMFIGVLIAALAAGAGLAIARIQLADAFPTVVHLRDAFDLPVLGSVSLVPEAARTDYAPIRLLAFASAVAALIGLYVWLIYLYHVVLWRPDLRGVADKLYFMMRSVF